MKGSMRTRAKLTLTEDSGKVSTFQTVQKEQIEEWKLFWPEQVTTERCFVVACQPGKTR